MIDYKIINCSAICGLTYIGEKFFFESALDSIYQSDLLVRHYI